MQAFEFLRTAGTRSVLPVYALVGEDAYLRREVASAIVRAALGRDSDDMAVSRFPGEHAALADVLDELRTLPFLAGRRVVIVENADPFVTAHRQALESYAERPAASGSLILQVKSWPATTRLARIVQKVGQTVDCKSPRESELPDWLVRLARATEQATLEPEAARLLLELVGPEIGLLANEVAKLATYVGERGTITREDVARLVGAGRVETIWKVLDAATSGQAAVALELLDRLLTSGEYPVPVLAAMTASLRKVHHAGMLRTLNLDLKEACARAGVPPFAVEQTRRQHAHLGPTRVRRLPELLLQADLDLKGSSGLGPREVLERLIVSLSRPRNDPPAPK